MDWLDLFQFVMFFGVFFFFIFVVGYMIYQEKKRCDALKAMAPKMGFTYVERDNSIRDKFAHLNIFKRGHSHENRNVMVGIRDGVKVTLNDYSYASGSGKNKTHYSYTICIITDPTLRLPHFYLRRENSFFDYLGKLFGGQDINFPEDERFSSAFVLQGMVESETRNYFNDRIRSAFIKFAGTDTQVEAQNDSLIIHRGTKLPPEQWGSLLKDTFSVYEVLRDNESDLLA